MLLPERGFRIDRRRDGGLGSYSRDKGFPGCLPDVKFRKAAAILK